MEPESIFIFVLLLLVLLLLVCYRRRRSKAVGTPPVVQREVKEEFSSSSVASTTGADFQGKSICQLFRENDVDAIVDKFSRLNDVSDAIRRAGLESCSLIFGIDYTGSNYMQGKKTFGGKCLHYIGPEDLNPYQKVICILGETLESFDDDGLIPAYGFGDTYTRDHSVFSLNPMGPCVGFQDVLKVYNDQTPKVRLGGPTNFAPLINQAIDIVKKNKKSFHILVIVADGQVTAERATTEAIVEASHYPLSIIMVGVGDGPWDTMKDFDNKLPRRRFDNFQFINFSAITEGAKNPQAAFALNALMEIPDQFKAARALGLLGN